MVLVHARVQYEVRQVADEREEHVGLERPCATPEQCHDRPVDSKKQYAHEGAGEECPARDDERGRAVRAQTAEFLWVHCAYPMRDQPARIEGVPAEERVARCTRDPERHLGPEGEPKG